MKTNNYISNHPLKGYIDSEISESFKSSGGGGNGGEGMIEKRLDKIEDRVLHIERDISDIKSDISSIKTQANFHSTKEDILELRNELTTAISGSHLELKTAISGSHLELKTENKSLQSTIHQVETRLIKWMVGSIFTVAALTFAILRFLK
jgi:chromosome segregation ATPase